MNLRKLFFLAGCAFTNNLCHEIFQTAKGYVTYTFKITFNFTFSWLMTFHFADKMTVLKLNILNLDIWSSTLVYQLLWLRGIAKMLLDRIMKQKIWSDYGMRLPENILHPKQTTHPLLLGEYLHRPKFLSCSATSYSARYLKMFSVRFMLITRHRYASNFRPPLFWTGSLGFIVHQVILDKIRMWSHWICFSTSITVSDYGCLYYITY